jgi:hypothetical protein
MIETRAQRILSIFPISCAGNKQVESLRDTLKDKKMLFVSQGYKGLLLKFFDKEKQIMEKQDTITTVTPQSTPSREELEQHVRTRAWKDDTFRQEFLTNPKAILERDYAQYFPEGKIPLELSIKVIEEEEQDLCFVLPPRLPDDQLSELDSINEEELLSLSGAGGYRPPRSIAPGCTIPIICPSRPHRGPGRL